MRCSGCEYPYSTVVYTRHNEDRTKTLRRHECVRCGLRFTTTEKHKENRRMNDETFYQEVGNR